MIVVFHTLTYLSFWFGSKKINEKLIYFESFHARQYSDNPKAIYEYIKNNFPEYKLVWGVKKGYEQPFIDNKVPYVHRFSKDWYFSMPKAKYWIINTRLPMWMYKSSNNIYIQTWHGTPLKRLAMDIKEVKMPETNNQKYKHNFIVESNRWDYLLAPNDFSEKIFKQAFNFKNTIINNGHPRTDYLIKNKENYELIVTLKEQLGISKEKKVVLYAPTWRDHKFIKKGEYKFEESFSFNRFVEKFGENTVLLIRSHYLVSDSLDLLKYNGNIINVSNYEDINDLLLISDTLITDYSSCFCEYSLLNKPIIFYMYDHQEYENKIRGFYEEIYNDLPGKIVTNEAQLFKLLNEKLSNKKESDMNLEFNQKYNSNNDGMSVKKVIEDIKNLERGFK